MHYDYLIVGAGLFGSVFAERAISAGKRVLVLEKRSHIGGNIYTEEVEGIQVHKYGAHIFHTNDKAVWDYINRFAQFNRYTNSPVANFHGELYSLPFNMYTFNRMWGVITPQEAEAEIRRQREAAGITEPQNLEEKSKWDAMADRVLFTGPIDRYFDYCLGPLQYRSVRFETEVLDTPNYQGNAVINYTDRETPYTRIIEHKHFVFGTQPKTVISREYSAEWQPGDEPYYPVNDDANSALYENYRALAEKERNVLFCGRLGEYRYYDMDVVIARALALAESLLF